MGSFSILGITLHYHKILLKRELVVLESVKLVLLMGIDELSPNYVIIEDDTCRVILCPREKDIKCFFEPLRNGYVIFSEVMTIQGLIELKDK